MKKATINISGYSRGIDRSGGSVVVGRRGSVVDDLFPLLFING